MSFWKGFAQALQEKSERDFQRETMQEEREYSREEWNRQYSLKRKAALEDMLLQRAMAGGGRGGSGGSSSSSNTNPSLYIKGLAQKGVSPEAITHLVSTGNKNSLQEAYELVESEWKTHVEKWGSNEESKERFGREVLGPVFGQMITENPNSVPVFNDEFKEMFRTALGGSLSSDLEALLNSTEVLPGGALFGASEVTPKLTPTEETQVNTVLKNSLMERANEKKIEIQNAVAYWRQYKDDNKFSPEEWEKIRLENLEPLETALMQLEEAISMASGETPSFVLLENLFGKDVRGNVTDYYKGASELPSFRSRRGE